MKHLTLSIFAISLLLPIGVYAQTTDTSKEDYLMCKQTALTKRENTMRPALALYETESTRITNETKEKLDTIKWYIDSSYKKNSEKILKDTATEMIPVTASITSTRRLAYSTWKAEDALCDFTQTKKTVVKGKK